MKLSRLLFAGFETSKRTRQAEVILAELTKRYGKPSLGRTRATFLSNHCVIKFPLSPDGERGNDWEGSVSADYLARGRIIEIGGFICVMQERLIEVDWEGMKYSDFPDWVGSIDCGQVGYDKKGRLKAFDFAR